jgi:hypothetical protein
MIRTLGIVIAISLAGCDEEPQRLPAHITDHVQVARAEPGPHCESMGALEGHSSDEARSKYESAYADLKDAAALRNGNYVVIDQVSSWLSGTDTEVVIRGRLYACALGLPAPLLRRPPQPVALEECR